jgi:hypothetical protein
MKNISYNYPFKSDFANSDFTLSQMSSVNTFCMNTCSSGSMGLDVNKTREPHLGKKFFTSELNINNIKK